MFKLIKIGLIFGALALSLFHTNGEKSIAQHYGDPLSANDPSSYYFSTATAWACILPLKDSAQPSVQSSPFPIVTKFIQGFTAVLQSKKPEWISIIHMHWTHPIVSIFYKDILYPFHFFF
jgi:hypothetical protein